jgi:flagellum-specific peptidoglycan hydrolase FlgJ
VENLMSKHTQVFDYAKKHWFKISLLILMAIACLKKDLSLSFRMNTDKTKQQLRTTNKESLDSKITAAAGESLETTPLSIVGNLFSSDTKKEEWANIDEETKKGFLRRFHQVAVAERKKYGIPASIILANALLQSYAGKRDVTLKNYNHFSLPCSFEWKGEGEKFGDKCYRKYENAWTSFRDHSVFITTGKFAKLRNYNNYDYKLWANGLEKLGYPSDINHLGDKLIEIIEKYELEQLDTM